MGLSRWQTTAGVICLVVGPVAQLAQYLVSPMKENASPAGQVAAAAAHSSAMQLGMVLDVLILLILPAVLYAGHVAGAFRSKLATAGTALTFVSALGAGYLLAQDVVVSAAAAQPGHQSAIGVVSGFENSSVVAGLVVFYLIGHVVGFILLGIALARSGAVPAWAGIALCVWPVAEMAGEAASLTVVATIGFALLVAGFGACARALVKEPAPAATAPAVAAAAGPVAV